MVKKIGVLIYAPIDAFPPTINAIKSFLDLGFEINGIEVSNSRFNHKKVVLNLLDTIKPFKKFPHFVSNYFTFILFCKKIYKLSKNEKIKFFVIYDAYGLLAYYLLVKIQIIREKKPVWYHNHDVADPKIFKRGSLGRLAHSYEQVLLKKVKYFTLPSKERASHFKYKSPDFILPNYPSIKLYKEFHSDKITDTINIIFQGRISSGHGIESCIEILNNEEDFRFNIILKGLISSEYKNDLVKLVQKDKINRVKFIGYSKYENLPQITSSCQIGLAIFQPKSFMHSTLGSSSNKIYEYMACGLPILYLSNAHFRSYLGNFDWALPVEDNPESIIKAIYTIIKDYDTLSKSARKTFFTELNYERFFSIAFKEFEKILINENTHS